MSAVVLMDIMGHVAKTVIRFNTLVLITIIIIDPQTDHTYIVYSFLIHSAPMVTPMINVKISSEGFGGTLCCVTVKIKQGK